MQRHLKAAAAAAAVAVLLSAAWIAYRESGGASDENANIVGGKQYEAVPIEGGVGPESFAFDPRGGGPYTALSDGTIVKWQPSLNLWLHFAVSHRDDSCGGPHEEHRKREHICGRPLGLCFNKNSGELYVADAYKGLLVVGIDGGIAKGVTPLVVEGEPLLFTNSLDIDQSTGVVYFTSSSSRYERRNYIPLALSKDKTGRLMKYDPESKQVTVLLNNLTFPNGVTLSKDGNYILIVETTNCRVLKYWLQTPKAGTLEVLTEVPGFPDNIKPSPRGGFWIGIHSRTERLMQFIMSHPWIGRMLMKLPLDLTKANSYMAKLRNISGLGIRISEEGDVLEIVENKVGRIGGSVSEVEERDGVLWVGSIDAPFAGKYSIDLAAKA